MLMNLPEIWKNQKNKPKIRKFKPNKTSKQTEFWYSRQLLGLVGALRKQVEGALQQPQSPFLMDSDNGFKAFDTQRFLAVVKKLAENDRLFNAENLAQEFVKRGNQQNAREVTANLQRQTGVDLQGFLGNSPALLEKVNLLTTANTQLIKSISSQYLDKVQTAVTQSVMTGKLNADLAKEIRQIGNVTESRARLIARDQSSKLNATLTQVRHQDVGIKKYRWSTSGDERVRTSHAENDGKIFSYDDPPETGHPGHGVNCRCVQIPVLDDVPTDKEKTPTEPSQKTEEKHFGVKSAELLLEKAGKIEPKITSDVTQVIASVGGKVEGLEYRLKSIGSLERKIKTEMLAGLSEKQAVERVKDVVRYTAIFDSNTFVEQYQKMQEQLAKKGYRTVVVKNTWQEGATYKGINTFVNAFVEKDNIIFEMQYHTQESFDLKNGKLHKLYEKFRNPETSLEEKAKISLEMQKLSANLRVPKDISLIKGKK
ncbi:minor capsid protein [Haemophilus haemoglobinophilus]|nr:minor capsid protein [Canicola haemoglobinophilus]